WFSDKKLSMVLLPHLGSMIRRATAAAAPWTAPVFWRFFTGRDSIPKARFPWPVRIGPKAAEDCRSPKPAATKRAASELLHEPVKPCGAGGHHRIGDPLAGADQDGNDRTRVSNHAARFKPVMDAVHGVKRQHHETALEFHREQDERHRRLVN